MTPMCGSAMPPFEVVLWPVCVAGGLGLTLYGLGLVGWPYDLRRGVKVLERMPLLMRLVVGGLLVLIGLYLTVVPPILWVLYRW